MSDQAVATTEKKAVVLTPHQKNVQNFRRLAESPVYMARFQQVLKDSANEFVASLVQLVSGGTYLAQCEPNSIMAAAITAAALRLPIDKNLGFAYIVPYGDQAQFQMGYRGFIQLAIRTGQYKFLNCAVVYDGDIEKYDELVSEIKLNTANRKQPEKVIGYVAYLRLVNGFEHAEYWTAAEVEAHARRYSQAYRKGKETPWKTDFDAMALKTVIKSLLSHWGIMSIEIQRATVRDQSLGAKSETAIDVNSEVVYPEAEIKRPAELGPPEAGDDGDLGPKTETDPAAAKEGAAEIDASASAVEKPYEKLVELAKAAEVTEDQIHRYMVSKNLAGKATTELPQASDTNMRTLIGMWSTVVGKIKATKVE